MMGYFKRKARDARDRVEDEQTIRGYARAVFSGSVSAHDAVIELAASYNERALHEGDPKTFGLFPRADLAYWCDREHRACMRFWEIIDHPPEDLLTEPDAFADLAEQKARERLAR